MVIEDEGEEGIAQDDGPADGVQEDNFGTYSYDQKTEVKAEKQEEKEDKPSKEKDA